MDTTRTDPYTVLRVHPQSTPEQIKRAFKDQVVLVHPDRGGDPEHFHIVREAYETLADPVARAAYDNERYAEAMWQHRPQPPAAPFQYGQMPNQVAYGYPQQPGAPGVPPRPAPANRPQPGTPGHHRSMPGFRFDSHTSTQILTLRAAFAVAAFALVAFRHVPLNLIFDNYGWTLEAVRFPIEAGLLAAVLAAVLAPKIWVWVSMPGHRWKTVAVIALILTIEVALASALIALAALAAVGSLALISGFRLPRR